jgi:hypothetical protein
LFNPSLNAKACPAKTKICRKNITFTFALAVFVEVMSTDKNII